MVNQDRLGECSSDVCAPRWETEEERSTDSLYLPRFRPLNKHVKDEIVIPEVNPIGRERIRLGNPWGKLGSPD